MRGLKLQLNSTVHKLKGFQVRTNTSKQAEMIKSTLQQVRGLKVYKLKVLKVLVNKLKGLKVLQLRGFKGHKLKGQSVVRPRENLR